MLISFIKLFIHDQYSVTYCTTKISKEIFCKERLHFIRQNKNKIKTNRQIYLGKINIGSCNYFTFEERESFLLKKSKSFASQLS